MNSELLKVSSIVGTGLMIAFSFTGIVPFAISGLFFLTIQTIHLKAWNLTGLNLVSIMGFIFQILSK